MVIEDSISLEKEHLSAKVGVPIVIQMVIEDSISLKKEHLSAKVDVPIVGLP